MGTVIFDSCSSDCGRVDWEKLESTSEEELALQIAEDDSEAAADAALYAAMRDKIVGRLEESKKTAQRKPPKFEVK